MPRSKITQRALIEMRHELVWYGFKECGLQPHELAFVFKESNQNINYILKKFKKNHD